MPKTTRKDLNSHNVAYQRLRSFWTLALDLKEPLPDTLQFYLNRYCKEDDQDFAERIKRLAQVNVLDLIIDSYCSMLFSTDVRISSKKNQDRVDAFVEQCNQKGDSLKEYFREIVAPMSFLYGSTDVFVDLPQKTDDVVSLDDQQRLGVDNPYCYVVPPLNRTAWELNDATEYTTYRSFDVINTQTRQSSMAVKDKKQFSEWTLDSVVEYTASGTEVKRRENPFGFIPAVTVIPLQSMRFHDDRIGLSLVQNVIPLQKLVLNLISLIVDFHESVNFAMRILKWDDSTGSPVPEGEILEGGNKKVLRLPGGQSDLKIVTPDAAGVEAMSRFLEDVIQFAYQDVKLNPDANMNKTHQSEKTIRGNNAPLYNRLCRIAKHFEKSIKRIIEMALRVQKIDPREAQVSVQWGTNFSFESFINSIEELTALRAVMQDMAPTAVAEIARKTVGPQLYNSEHSDDIEAEIDKWVGQQKTLDPLVVQAQQKGLPTNSQTVGDQGTADKITEEEGQDAKN